MAVDYITISCSVIGIALSMESYDAGEGFSGRLDNFPLLDVIQMACVAQRDGRLQISHDAERAAIVLSKGQIVHAETEKSKGEEALFEILCWQTGRFVFSPFSLGTNLNRTIKGGWEHVLMEAVRLRDERFSALPVKPILPGLRSELAKSISQKLSEHRRRTKFVRWAFRAAILTVFSLVIAIGFYFVPPLKTGFKRINQLVRDRFISPRHLKLRTPAEISIPAGAFIYQDGQIVLENAFEIDSMEIPIWQYEEFLSATGNRTDFDHPNQPKNKTHTNPKWRAYSQAAFDFGEFEGVPVNPNCPAVFLDWYDAYAYAKWRGRTLPTEREWEKAARGTDGRKYPWGDQAEAGRANLLESGDRPVGWSEIGSFPKDRSPYGVLDMAGNVSEWTESTDEIGNPIVRGGNFRNSDGRTTRRVTRIPPLTSDERIGFRTVSCNTH
jgi:hypothetical protein